VGEKGLREKKKETMEVENFRRKKEKKDGLTKSAGVSQGGSDPFTRRFEGEEKFSKKAATHRGKGEIVPHFLTP